MNKRLKEVENPSCYGSYYNVADVDEYIEELQAEIESLEDEIVSIDDGDH